MRMVHGNPRHMVFGILIRFNIKTYFGLNKNQHVNRTRSNRNCQHHIKTLEGNIGELIAPKEAMVKRIMEYISDTFLKSITKQEMRDTIFY